MADIRLWSKGLIAELLILYKSQTCLWKTKSEDYKSRQLKESAYQKLVKFCKDNGMPEANRDFVVRKIQSLRGSFRKELKKVLESQSNGKSNIYKPNLWYYDLLLFTKDQETLTDNFDNDDEQTEDFTEEIETHFIIDEGQQNTCVTIKEEQIHTSSDEDEAQNRNTWRDLRRKSRTEESVASRTRSTAKQLNLLTEYMSTHFLLAQGKYSATVGILQERKKWEELRDMLNEHGPDKTVEQWKVTWRDLRRKVRAEEITANPSGNSADNDSTVPVLSEQTIKVLGGMTNEESIGIHCDEEPGMKYSMEVQTEDDASDHTPSRKRRLESISQTSQSEYLKPCTDMMKGNMTEFDALGINTAIKMAKMDSIQAIYAESLIANVLRKGLLNKLTDDTHLCDECTHNSII